MSEVRPLFPSQHVLNLGDAERADAAGIRVRATVRAYAKRVGYKRVGALWGLGDDCEGLVSQKIDEKERRAMKPHELIAVIAADNDGDVIGTICDETGWERPERRVEPATGEERLLSAASELFGDEVVELLRRKAGV